MDEERFSGDISVELMEWLSIELMLLLNRRKASVLLKMARKYNKNNRYGKVAIYRPNTNSIVTYNSSPY